MTDHLRSLAAYRRVKPAASERQWQNARNQANKRRRDRGEAEIGLGDEPTVSFPDKAVGTFDWREWAAWAQAGQELRGKAAWSNHVATVEIDTDQPILVVPISDFHWGSWATDYAAVVRFTNELLAIPNLYLLILGDMEQQAIRLRGVIEVADNLLPPEAQTQFTEAWLNEVAPRVLATTWDNHAVQRQEDLIGQSPYATLMKRRFVYFSGIGHVDVRVGEQSYRLAVSHKFRGGSVNDPCAGQKNYMLREGLDREIAIQGDTHRPGRASYYNGPVQRLAINCGTLQTNSGYAQRFFSLFSMPVFPCFELYPDTHMFNDYESLAHWKKATMNRKAA